MDVKPWFPLLVNRCAKLINNELFGGGANLFHGVYIHHAFNMVSNRVCRNCISTFLCPSGDVDIGNHRPIGA